MWLKTLSRKTNSKKFHQCLIISKILIRPLFLKHCQVFLFFYITIVGRQGYKPVPLVLIHRTVLAVLIDMEHLRLAWKQKSTYLKNIVCKRSPTKHKWLPFSAHISNEMSCLRRQHQLLALLTHSQFVQLWDFAHISCQVTKNANMGKKGPNKRVHTALCPEEMHPGWSSRAA